MTDSTLINYDHQYNVQHYVYQMYTTNKLIVHYLTTGLFQFVHDPIYCLNYKLHTVSPIQNLCDFTLEEICSCVECIPSTTQILQSDCQLQNIT